MTRSEFLFLTFGLTNFYNLNATLLKKFDPLILIGKGNPKMMGDNFLLIPKVYDALKKMSHAARNDGIQIKVVSAYRSYSKQKAIWNRKFILYEKKGLKKIDLLNEIIKYSTIPGTSRHHWGTEIDIIDGSKQSQGDVLLTKKFHEGGPYNKLRQWMELNGSKFGFFKPYTNDSDRKGFFYEPWHYSYAEISRPMLKAYIEINAISLIKTHDLLGANLLDIKFISSYLKTHILGINKILL